MTTWSRSNPKESFGFLVNNWNFIGSGTSGDKKYPYLDDVGKHYEVTKLPGVRGQNLADPLAIFSNHVIAHIDGTLYDPSYGVTYEDTGPDDRGRRCRLRQSGISRVQRHRNPETGRKWRTSQDIPGVPLGTAREILVVRLLTVSTRNSVVQSRGKES